MEVIQIPDPKTGSVSGHWIQTPDPDQIRFGGGLRSPGALVNVFLDVTFSKLFDRIVPLFLQLFADSFNWICGWSNEQAPK